MEPLVYILVVDDEPDIRCILRILLESRGYCVAEAANGAAAVEYMRTHTGVDLIIMDVMMPKLGGVEASRSIRALTAAPILFLTARTQERDKLAAYYAGGDDYLAKPFSHGELLMKVESLLRRYRVYKGKPNGRMLSADVMLDEDGHHVIRGGEQVDLTEKEFDILCFLAERRGKVISVKDIYETVWHEKYIPTSSNTVMVHILNLRKKLEDDPTNPRLIRTVWGKGYQLD